MFEQNKKTNWLYLIGIVVIVLLAVEVVMLILQNRQLKAALIAMAAPPMIPLQRGDRVEHVKLQDMNDNTVDLFSEDSKEKKLLFVFSLTCPHCEKNLVKWQSIIDNNTNSHCDFIGISTRVLEGTKKYVKEHNVRFQSFCAEIDTSFRRKYGISIVPQTILINSNRTVEKVWLGELNDEQIYYRKLRILNQFHVVTNIVSVVILRTHATSLQDMTLYTLGLVVMTMNSRSTQAALIGAVTTFYQNNQ